MHLDGGEAQPQQQRREPLLVPLPAAQRELHAAAARAAPRDAQRGAHGDEVRAHLLNLRHLPEGACACVHVCVSVCVLGVRV